MTQRAHEVTKDQLIEEFNAVVSETETLLKSVATAGGEKAGALRSSVEHGLAAAKTRLHGLQQQAGEKARAVAKTSDDYVHANPWRSIGVAAGLAALTGVALALLLKRR